MPTTQRPRPARAAARALALALLALAALLPPHTGTAAPQPLAATDWPQYRHDPQRSGRASATLPSASKLHLQWAYSVGERVEVEVEPIVAGGRVYVGSMNGVMTALNASDGSVAWTFQAGPIPHSAAFDSGRLFFGSLDGKVYALDAATGAQLWSYTTGGPVYAAPTVSGASVYIGSTDGRFYALGAATGALSWAYPAAGAAGPFTGAAALSPDGSRLYVGNEDMVARALDAATGVLVWQRQLLGVGMRQTHPVVSDDGQTVFFQTTKPGVQSYVPTEDYPRVSLDSNPVDTWNAYYQAHPERRATFFLRASDGAERWDPASKAFVPLPIPYWGMLAPVLDGSGNAVFPSPGGGVGTNIGDYALNHDSRLMRVSMGTGAATQIAAREAFYMRADENGRATMAGSQYVTTISEDVGAYDTAGGAKATLFANPTSGFASHMDPLAPLPSKHLWRYGGVVAMGGVPGASTAVVAGGMVFYVSYGWVFALGAANKGLDPSGTTPVAGARDARASTFTYLRASAPTPDDLRAELNQRVADLVASGGLATTAKFEQAGIQMTDDVSGFQLFGTTGEQMWVLSQALRFVSAGQRTQTLAYMKTLAQNELFNQARYQYGQECLVYGQSGIQRSAVCQTAASGIIAAWQADNDLLTGERLYAMAAYAESTGDWSLVASNYSFIKGLFSRFVTKYNPALGFDVFEKWHSGKLGIASQIGAAAGMLRMAQHQGDAATAAQAQALLESLLTTRVALANTVPALYAAGQISPQAIRIDPDGVPNHDDIFAFNDNGEIIPLEGDRTAATDVRQVNWQSPTELHYHSSAGFMHYAALVGYSPLYPELADRLRRDLLPQTHRYVQTYEVNQPWWWMGDLAHHTTSGGEHLWESPTLSHDMFQTKALVLQEDYSTLARELPLPMTLNPRYDLYRLHNIATLLALSTPNLSASSLWSIPAAPKAGTDATVRFAVRNTGGPLSTPVSVSVTLPPELAPVAGSESADLGSVSVSGSTLTWTGSPGSAALVFISVKAHVSTAEVKTVQLAAQLTNSESGPASFSYPVILNGSSVALPLIDQNR